MHFRVRLRKGSHARFPFLCPPADDSNVARDANVEYIPCEIPWLGIREDWESEAIPKN